MMTAKLVATVVYIMGALLAGWLTFEEAKEKRPFARAFAVFSDAVAWPITLLLWARDFWR